MKNKIKYIQSFLLTILKMDFYPSNDSPELKEKISTFQESLNSARTNIITSMNLDDLVNSIQKIAQEFKVFEEYIKNNNVIGVQEYIDFFNKNLVNPDLIKNISNEYDFIKENHRLNGVAQRKIKNGIFDKSNFYLLDLQDVNEKTKPIHAQPQEIRQRVSQIMIATQKMHSLSSIFITPESNVPYEEIICFLNKLKKITQKISKKVEIPQGFLGLNGSLSLSIFGKKEKKQLGCFHHKNSSNLTISFSTRLLEDEFTQNNKDVSVVLHEWIHALDNALTIKTKNELESLLLKSSNTEKKYYEKAILRVKDMASRDYEIHSNEEIPCLNAYNLMVQVSRDLQCENPHLNKERRENYKVQTLIDYWEKNSSLKFDKLNISQRNALTSSHMFNLLQMQFEIYEDCEDSNSPNDIHNRIEQILMENEIPLSNQEIKGFKNLKKMSAKTIEFLNDRFSKINSKDPINGDFSEMKLGSKSVDDLSPKYTGYYQDFAEMVARNAESQFFPMMKNVFNDVLKPIYPQSIDEEKEKIKNNIKYMLSEGSFMPNFVNSSKNLIKSCETIDLSLKKRSSLIKQRF